MMPALRRLTWRRLAVALAIALALLAWYFIEGGLTVRRLQPLDLARALMHLAMALCLLPATLLADDAVDRGSPPLLAYAAAVLGGTLAATLLQSALVAPLPAGDVGPLLRILPQHPMARYLEFLLWGAIVVAVYANRRRAQAAAARLQALQLRRTQAQQRVLSSQLLALQARVEPRFLFNTLALVRDLYEVDRGRAAAMLDDLIVYLRNALPQMRLAGSTVAREIELVGAYLRILQAQQRASAPSFRVRVASGLDDAPMPPMLLLPLVERLVSMATQVRREIEIGVDGDAATLRIEVADERGSRPIATTTTGMLAEIDERLRQLFDGRARLEVDTSLPRGLRYRMTLPWTPAHAPADGDPR